MDDGRQTTGRAKAAAAVPRIAQVARLGRGWVYGHRGRSEAKRAIGAVLALEARGLPVKPGCADPGCRPCADWRQTQDLAGRVAQTRPGWRSRLARLRARPAPAELQAAGAGPPRFSTGLGGGR